MRGEIIVRAFRAGLRTRLIFRKPACAKAPTARFFV